MTRPAAVAGMFYPKRPDDLRNMIASCLPAQPHPTGEALPSAKAVLVPHAGYIYSGPVAGAVFASVGLPGRILLLGPNHTGSGSALALAPVEDWDTPLGKSWIDEDLNRLLLAECPALREDSRAHRHEHCLEVQIPFLQALRSDFRFAALCIGTMEYSALEALGHAMARVILAMEEPVLIVISSDMTHYQSAEAASHMDRLAIDRMLALDPRGLYEVVLEREISMCGFAPAVAALTACRDLGASEGRLACYSHSGEASGDCERVVGYAGIVIY